jgi:hypothetical protein
MELPESWILSIHVVWLVYKRTVNAAVLIVIVEKQVRLLVEL